MLHTQSEKWVIEDTVERFGLQLMSNRSIVRDVLAELGETKNDLVVIDPYFDDSCLTLIT